MSYPTYKSKRRLRDFGISVQKEFRVWMGQKRASEKKRADEERKLKQLLYWKLCHLIEREPGGVHFQWLDNGEIVSASDLIPADSWTYHLLQHAESHRTLRTIHQCNDVLAFTVEVRKPGSFCGNVFKRPLFSEHWVLFCCFDLFTIEKLGALRETPRPASYEEYFEYEVWQFRCDRSHWSRRDQRNMWSFFSNSCK